MTTCGNRELISSNEGKMFFVFLASTGGCPLSWTKHEGLCYKQMPEPKGCMDARCECAKYGAIVATLSTPAKMDFINTWVNGTMDNYLLGADRLRGTMFLLPSSHYKNLF